jgi:hypothetical protein
MTRKLVKDRATPLPQPRPMLLLQPLLFGILLRSSIKRTIFSSQKSVHGYRRISFGSSVEFPLGPGPTRNFGVRLGLSPIAKADKMNHCATRVERACEQIVKLPEVCREISLFNRMRSERQECFLDYLTGSTVSNTVISRRTHLSTVSGRPPINGLSVAKKVSQYSRDRRRQKNTCIGSFVLFTRTSGCRTDSTTKAERICNIRN